MHTKHDVKAKILKSVKRTKAKSKKEDQAVDQRRLLMHEIDLPEAMVDTSG